MQYAIIKDKVKSEHEVERLSQLQYGRKKLVMPTPSTSTYTSASTGAKIMDNKQVNKQVNKQPKKIQKVGHEACLAKVISERRMIEVTLISGLVIRGELVEFDKFSVRIRHADETYTWYFKGSMIGFSEV